MRFFPVVILLFSIVLSGCSGARIYTFEKDRVDQRTEGNRGYVKGTPPPEPVKKSTAKRTMIGIDMEVPLLPGEKGYKTTCGGTVIHADDIKMKPTPAGKKKKTPEKKPAGPVYEKKTVIIEEKTSLKQKSKEVIVEEEDVWIK